MDVRNIYLCSAATKHKNNTRSSFTYILPQKTKYENLYVALSEIYIDCSFVNVLRGNKPHLIMRCLNKHRQRLEQSAGTMTELLSLEVYNDTTNNTFLLVTVIFNTGLYTNVAEFTNVFNKALGGSGAEFVHRDSDNRFYLFVNESVSHMYMCAPIADLLGVKFIPDTKFPDLSRNDRILKNLPELLGIAAGEYISIGTGTTHTGHLTNFNRNIYKPELLKIYLTQIDSNIENHATSKLLCTAPGPPENDSSVYRYAPRNLEYSRLLGGNFDKCEVEIRDEKNNSVLFSFGKATYIKLEVRHAMSRTHVVSVDSGDEGLKRIFPHNTNSRFSVMLPHTLKTERQWGVKLLKLSHSNRVHNIEQGLNQVRYKWDGEISHSTLIRPGYYSSVAEITRQLSHSANSAGAVIDWSIREGYVTVSTKLKVVVSLNCELAIILGLTNLVTVSDHILHLESLSTVQAPFQHNITLGRPNFIKVHCAQAENSVFSEAGEPLIAFLCLSSAVQNSSTFYYEAENPTTLRLETRNVSRLDFSLVAENGAGPINFADDTATRLVVTLAEV